MRSCLISANGKEVWTDDDRQDPADKITILGENGYVHIYYYDGTHQTTNHSYRRYVERENME